jgi:uncharacterized protein (DUF1501 family)
MLNLDRRQFIRAGSLASASLILPRCLKAFERKRSTDDGKILVVVQLSGGNDGLNTVIPFRNDIYHKMRPEVGIKRPETLTLTDELGLHPALKGLKALYDDGALGILNNVGYPDPDRSHFRAMEIWQTAGSAGKAFSTGWIGRYLDAQCGGCGYTTGGIEINNTLSLAMKGANKRGIAASDPRRLYAGARNTYFKSPVHGHPVPDDAHNVDQRYKTRANMPSSADHISK